jgi:hypothetical protein
VALLLLVVPLAGCTLFKPPPGPALHACLGEEAFVVPDLGLRMANVYGFINVSGRGLAVPVKCGASEEGAVYLNVTTAFHADLVFQDADGTLPGDVFVQAPAGAWPGQRSQQAWARASSADLAAFGYADLTSALVRASQVVPGDNAPPKPQGWTLNGTIVATLSPDNITVVLEQGPSFFTRNTSNVLVLESDIILTYNLANQTLTIKSGAALAAAEIKDPGVADFAASWGQGKVELRVLTRARFRASDLTVTEAGPTVIAVEFPGVALMSMVQVESKDVRDNHVQLRGGNATVLMEPV